MVEGRGCRCQRRRAGRGGLPVGSHVVTPFLRNRDALAFAGLIADVAGGYEVPPSC